MLAVSQAAGPNAAEWTTAVATSVLAVVTSAALYFAWRAAQGARRAAEAANDTLKLDQERLLREHEETERRAQLIASGVFLEHHRPDPRVTPVQTQAVASNHSGEPISRLIIEFHTAEDGAANLHERRLLLRDRESWSALVPGDYPFSRLYFEDTGGRVWLQRAGRTEEEQLPLLYGHRDPTAEDVVIPVRPVASGAG